jgi:hypothetical protein
MISPAIYTMQVLVLQLLTSFTATGLITFTVTHLHAELVSWLLWSLHWIIAWPIAFVTIRWIAPVYSRTINVWFKNKK